LWSGEPRAAVRAKAMGMLMNWNTIWTDGGRELSVFECSHSHFHRQNAEADGLVASANHHQFLDRTLSGSFDPTEQELMAGSYSRLARMWALLREYQGGIDPMVANSITSDHIPDYSPLRRFGVTREWWEGKLDDSTICAHPWNFFRHVLKGEFEAAYMEAGFSTTLYSIQVQPEKMTVWFTNGNPCRNPTLPLYWGRLLGTGRGGEGAALDPAAFRKAPVVAGGGGMFRRDAGPAAAFLTSVWMRVTEAFESHYSNGA